MWTIIFGAVALATVGVAAWVAVAVTGATRSLEDATLAALLTTASGARAHAVIVEREKALGAQPYERTPVRAGHASGF